ncbi:hypothetical protein DFJ58DRAFT_848828 [Suillus subalutaceus]|uniref:uncharacterized protein n=1 Tax=Suillus subalutaceus TaxID=48586 RepID=UPI001B87622A|nr:uncharacterized protein DFJ58DRAFT_848828 [Suillus subalutaceus]KAG1829051.1 hypothetical protein DFJ58DRAFT_848828 [Suillus subalutaceus]
MTTNRKRELSSNQGKKVGQTEKRALKATYQDNPDIFEKEPSELLSDADRDEDTMFSDHILQTKLSNTKILAFSMGKIPPASHTTSGSTRKLKAPAINTPQDDTSDDTSDKSGEDPESADQSQSEAGAGHTDEEDGHSDEEQIPAPRATKRSHDTEDTMVVLKIKKNSDGSHQCAKASDFDDVSKDVLAPFPDTIAAETMLAKEAWHEACQIKGINVKLTPSAVKMLLKRTSHVRGELKTKMRSLTRLFFGFRSSDSREVVRQNRDLAESLKDGSSFVYKDWTAKTGIYKTKLLQEGINVMWFANQNDEGVVYHKHFNPMPTEIIALTLTAIECCIDEWLQGLKEDITFTAATYGCVYQTHLSSLQRFDERTAPYKLFERICNNLHDVARFHAGVEGLATTVSDASQISDKAFEDAIREHQLQEEEDARQG